MNAHAYYGFGGAYALALHNQGIALDRIVEPGGFGLPVIEANRERVNFNGSIYKNPEDVEFDESLSPTIVMGNPPCSGFSTLNHAIGKNSRGSTSAINDCMWELVEYAARVRPEVVVFESVPAAYSQGLALMYDLWERLKFLTDEHWYLQLVKMSGASVGNPQRRHRFFWLASKQPIGVHIPDIERVVTIRDAIDDLRPYSLVDDHQEVVQAYQTQLSPYGYLMTEGVTSFNGHMDITKERDRILIEHAEPGFSQRDTLQRLVELDTYGEFWTEQRVKKDLSGSGFSGMYRIHADGLSRVITGGGAWDFIHYEEPRLLTIREVARIMGFPDDFSWGPEVGSINQRSAFLGKQVPVQSWSWMLGSIKSTLEGRGDLYYGKPVEPGVSLIDITYDYKKVFNERKRTHTDSRNKEWIKEMESRELR